MKLIKNINYKKILSLFLKQNGSPFFNAKGAALGVFCGCFPFFGFQTLLGLFLAKVAIGNVFLAVIGTWISNPFTYVPLYLINYKVGASLVKTSTEIIVDRNSLINDLWNQGSVFSLRLILGSTLVGLFLASIAGGIVFLFYKKGKNKNLKF